jgi:hypothetical protein
MVVVFIRLLPSSLLFVGFAAVVMAEMTEVLVLEKHQQYARSAVRDDMGDVAVGCLRECVG